MEHRGIHVYNCDNAAKRIMASSEKIQSDLIKVVGNDVVLNGHINKAVLSSFLLESESNALKINNIVHPMVADDFINSGGAIQYEESALQEFSNNFYNIMLSVGIAVAVIMGGILGIKYMASSVEERAATKKILIAYAVGCVVVFGGFAIWKLVVTILQAM